ncbi:MAG: hypothetical protein AAF597_02830 [Bacteroidota bacterium]
MRLLITLFLLLTFTATAEAQTNRELGLRATGLNNGSLLYRVEQANGKWRRLHFGFADLTFSTSQGFANGGLSLGLAVGWENRRRLADRLELLHGWEPFASLTFVTSGNGSAAAIAGGVGYVVGAQYTLSEHFYMGLEITPAVTAMLNEVGNATRLSIDAGIDLRSVALTAVYRFTTE